MTMTSFQGDRVTLLPRCKCGVTEGFFPPKTVCTVCGHEIKNDITQPIDYALWFRKPKGVNALINPHYWLALKSILDTSGFNILLYLTDKDYRPKQKNTPMIGALINAGVVDRGYNYFVDNIFSILQACMTIKKLAGKIVKLKALVAKMVSQPDMVLTDYIPLPNKTVLVMEFNSLGIFRSASMAEARDAINTMVGIDDMPFIRNIQNRTAKCLDKICVFYTKYFDSNFKPKEGWIRKHLAGSRLNFTFRCVLTSITQPHDYDELHVPWCMAVVTFRHHLVSKMMKLIATPYSWAEANKLIYDHANTYHPLLAELLDSFITDANNQLYCIVQRNPSMAVGSAQRMRITKFKKDTLDRSMSTSILSMKSMTADVDGDFLNAFLPMDITISLEMQMLDLSSSVYDFDEPLKLGGYTALSKPCVVNTAMWLSEIPL